MTTMLKNAEILAAPGLEDWRKLGQALHGRFLTGSFTTGLRFVTAVTQAAEEANHHPDVTLTYPLVDLRLITHDAVFRDSDDVEHARRCRPADRRGGRGRRHGRGRVQRAVVHGAGGRGG
jgi:4a-hydroxytetrahydrobiopterin dehydratase